MVRISGVGSVGFKSSRNLTNVAIEVRVKYLGGQMLLLATFLLQVEKPHRFAMVFLCWKALCLLRISDASFTSAFPLFF
jgi:hypothetical protein